MSGFVLMLLLLFVSLPGLAKGDGDGGCCCEGGDDDEGILCLSFLPSYSTAC